MGKEMRNHTELRIRGVSHAMRDQLFNISKNEGTSISDLLKPKIREVIESYPVHMRQPPRDY